MKHKKSTVKRILGILTGLSLALGLMPGEPLVVKAATTTVSSWNQFTNACITASAGDTIQLSADISTPATFSSAEISKNLTVDLNGHGIIVDLSGENPAIKIQANCTLNLIDSDPSTTHKISLNTNGRGYVDSSGSITVNGGFITGGENTSGGGGGAIGFTNNNQTLKMYGGTLIGNIGDGGALSLTYGSAFYMYGGKIENNKSKSNGWSGGNAGGIYVAGQDRTIYIAGGSIRNNKSGSGNESNVALFTSSEEGFSPITLSDNPEDGTEIGVTILTSARAVTGGEFTTGLTSSNAEAWEACFSSDSDLYSVSVDSTSHQLTLVERPQYEALTNTAPTVAITKGNGNTINDNPQLGDTLTVTPSPANATPVTYQWYRGTTAITGATEATYTVVADDVAKKIHAVVTQAADSGGAGIPSADIVATSAESAIVKKHDGPAAPASAENAGFTIDYENEDFSINNAYEVSSDSTDEGTAITSLTDALDGSGKVYIREKESNEYEAGEWLEVVLTARPVAPSGLTTESASTGTAEDGKIKNTTIAMEYSGNNGTSWTQASAGETTVKAGTYLVRTKATNTAPAGNKTTVIVGSREIVLSDNQKPTAKTNLVCTDNPQVLLNQPANESLPEGATGIQYALGENGTNAPASGWGTSIPTGKDSGTYYVWYKAKGDANHNDSTATCIVVVIGEKVSVSYTVTFKVVNGAWNDGTTEDKNVVLSGYEGDTLKLTENQIPAVGSKPNDNYKAGNWDVVPTTSMVITTDKTFAYTYTQDKSGTQGTTNEEVIQEDNTPKANVSGLDNNLTNNIMTPQEKAMVNSGQNSILKLIMKNIDASVPQQDKNLTEEEIKKVSNNANVAMFLDLSLWLTIGHNYSRQIESTGEHKIGVELEVPEDKRAPAGVIRTFLVVQIHNNASNIIARTTAIHIPLVISDFSTYALAYVDEPAEKVGFYSGLKITQKNDKIKISWDKTEGVAKYEAYVTYCGKKYPKKPTKSTTSNSVTIKKIKDKKIDFTKNFKLYVAAYDGNGNIIGKSVNAHFAGKDSKEYKNPKDIKLKTKSITIAKGQTSKIKASVKMEKGKGKELSDNHAPKFRYKTTNTNVATVDKKGKVTGVNSGTCIIYVYAKNGRAQKVVVTVN